MKYKPRFIIILPILAVLVYCAIILLFQKDAANSIDENDRVVAKMEIMVLGLTLLPSTPVVYLIMEKIPSANLFVAFGTTAFMHFLLIGAAIDGLILLIARRRRQKQQIEEALWTGIKRAKE